MAKLQFLDVSDEAAHLDSEGKVLRRCVPSSWQRPSLRGQMVEAVIKLQCGKVLGVEIEPPRLWEAGRIEYIPPMIITPAAGADMILGQFEPILKVKGPTSARLP